MALTDQQIGELNIAQSRVDAGNPLGATDDNAGDIANLASGVSQGFEPISAATPVASSPTTPVKLDVKPTIPVETLSAPPVSANDISQQLLASSQLQQTQTQTFLDEFKSLKEQTLAATEPGDVETGLITDIQDITQQARVLRTSFRAGVNKITGQSIPMSIAMGQTRQLENQANNRLEALANSQAPLVDTLNTLQSAREVKLTQLNILSQFARDNFTLLQNDAQANRELQFQIFQIQREEQQFKAEESRFALDFAIKNGVTSRFFKFPDDPTVYDLQQSGKPLNFEEYQQLTGQVGKAPQNTLFDNVQTLSPQEPEGDFQFVAGTDTQESGYFNKNTGEFIPFEQFKDQPIPISTVQASGGIQTIEMNGRGLSLDAVTVPSLDIINQQASQFGGLKIGAVATSTHRTNQQQAELFKIFQEGGPQAAPPGFSSHEIGMAIDLFPDQGYIAQMKPIMNQNGWFQTAGNNDLGHFQYLGSQPEVAATAVNPFIQDLLDLGDEFSPEQAYKKIDDLDLPDEQKNIMKMDYIAGLADIPEDTLEGDIGRQKSLDVLALQENSALNSAVGPNITKIFSRFKLGPDAFGEREFFIGAIDQLVSDLALQALIDAKSRGATFGALSDTEMEILKSAATKLGTWTEKKKDKNKPSGFKTVGYNISQKRFKEELAKISDILLAGQDENRFTTDDGIIWERQEDGNLKRIGIRWENNKIYSPEQ